MKTNKKAQALQKIKKNVLDEQQKKSIDTINAHLRHVKSLMGLKGHCISI